VDRRTFITGIAGGILAAPLAAGAQEAGNVTRIGVLSELDPPDLQLGASLALALRELGWMEGQNLLIEWRDAHGNIKRLPEMANDLVRLRVDVIVARSNHAIAAAKQATTSIPIVMWAAGDPVGSGFVASLVQPGGNVTGTTIHTPEVAGKLWEVLKEAVPRARRVSVIFEPEWPGQATYVREGNAAARALGLRIQYLEVRGLPDVDAALVRVGREPPDALYVVSTGAVFAERHRIFAFAMKRRVPTIAPGTALLAKAGCLITYGFTLAEVVRRTAALVDKILRGAKPADLPVEQPTKFELVINLKTARALGLTIPRSILSVADEVIQ
jgi:ABC-type uncharacterized transport system substrate-binding protein